MKLLHYRVVSFTVSYSQALWCQDPLTLLKIVGDFKELFSVWVLSINIYLIRNKMCEFFKHKAIVASGTFQKTPLYTHKKVQKANSIKNSFDLTDLLGRLSGILKVYGPK